MEDMNNIMTVHYFVTLYHILENYIQIFIVYIIVVLYITYYYFYIILFLHNIIITLFFYEITQYPVTTK